MSATTWSEIVCRHYNLGADVAFDGNKLVHAISHNNVLNSLFEGNDGMVKEDIAVFQNKYQARGMMKQVHCFYATLQGERPKGVNASSQWHLHINSATDLLQKKITRSTTLSFECSNITVTLEVKKLDADTLRKRKWPQTHDNIAETSIQMKEISVLDMNSQKICHHWPNFPAVRPHTSFWLSPEAFILFKPVDSETVLEAIKNQIEFLGEANKSDFGYTELIKI
jgi:hypothetical protein